MKPANPFSKNVPSVRLSTLLAALMLALLAVGGFSSAALAVVDEPAPPDGRTGAAAVDATMLTNQIFLPFVIGSGQASNAETGLGEITAAADAVNMCFTGTGPGEQISSNIHNGWAGVFNVTVNGSNSQAFCADINNSISSGNCYSNSTIGPTNAKVACT